MEFDGFQMVATVSSSGGGGVENTFEFKYSLCDKCRECPGVSKCNSKRIEACAYLIPEITINIDSNITRDEIIKNVSAEIQKLGRRHEANMHCI